MWSTEICIAGWEIVIWRIVPIPNFCVEILTFHSPNVIVSGVKVSKEVIKLK